jgi:hypothetical protein
MKFKSLKTNLSPKKFLFDEIDEVTDPVIEENLTKDKKNLILKVVENLKPFRGLDPEIL